MSPLYEKVLQVLYKFNNAFTILPTRKLKATIQQCNAIYNTQH